jgi:hypothetical protein
MRAATACPNLWQIFGKMGFDDNSPEEGKVRITAYLLVILMVGLGGLEPPTSPLSELRSLATDLPVPFLWN